MGKLLNLKGKRFGRLLVISYGGMFPIGKYGRRQAKWLCNCDCGNTISVPGSSLRSGKTKSCGCLQKESRIKANTIHGCTGTSIYRSWQHMKARCLTHADKDFKHYGGRGIKICERWENFENFLADMGEKPEGLTIERIDNDGNYEPDNCKWATQKEQLRNSRNNRIICYQGESRLLIDWANILGIGRSTLAYRLNHYPVEIAFNMKKWSKRNFNWM